MTDQLSKKQRVITLPIFFTLLLVTVLILGLLTYLSYRPTVDRLLRLNSNVSLVAHVNKFPSLKTPQEYADYNSKTEKIAVSAPYLDITSCSPSPLILKVKANSQLLVKNGSEKEHLLTLNEKSTFLVGPHTNTSLLLNTYPVVPGAYSYHCDQKLNVGLIYVQL